MSKLKDTGFDERIFAVVLAIFGVSFLVCVATLVYALLGGFR